MNKDLDIAFFLPTRSGSERVINKNTRQFGNVEGGLLKIKLDQLLSIPNIPIFISTNDSETMRIAENYNSDRIKIIVRPEELCLSSTIIEDFIKYIPTVIEASHIFWVHVTSPFVDATHYKEVIEIYKNKVLSGEYDSLLSVTKIQQFLYDKETKKYINHDRTIEKWPRTQDLKPVYEINHAYYINSKENYLKYNDRIGIDPYLIELNKLQSFDIDWEDDFKIAEIIYDSIKKI